MSDSNNAKSDVPSPKPINNVEWWTFEIKIREFYDKRSFEYFKASTEYSKLIVTNLIVINAGGLLSIPTINNFMVSILKSKDGQLILVSVVCFIVGLIFALLCGFVTYRNFLHLVQATDHRGLEHLNMIQGLHPVAAIDSQYKTSVAEGCASQARLALAKEKQVNRTYKLGQFFGWCSVAAFLVGALRLIYLAF